MIARASSKKTERVAVDDEQLVTKAHEAVEKKVLAGRVAERQAARRKR